MPGLRAIIPAVIDNILITKLDLSGNPTLSPFHLSIIDVAPIKHNTHSPHMCNVNRYTAEYEKWTGPPLILDESIVNLWVLLNFINVCCIEAPILLMLN